MGRKLAFDKLLFSITLIMVFVGIVTIYSASAVMALETYRTPYHFLVKQGVAAFLGLLLMIQIMYIDYRKLQSRLIVFLSLGFSFALLIALILLKGTPFVGGAADRWFYLFGISFQPSEVMKIALILFLAFFLSRSGKDINNFFGTILPALVIVCLAAALVVKQPDLGTAMIFLMIALIIAFCAGLRWLYISLAGLGSILALCILIAGSSYTYQMERIRGYWDPWQDRFDGGFQAVQSQIAIGTGGIFGRGLVAGKQKLFFLPESHNDFIYSVIGEEMGLIGCLLILLFFSILLWRGLRASLRAPDKFGLFLGIGITAMIVFQAFINISVAVTLFPTKGIPLPFISAGGTSLIVTLASVGILLNISQHSN